MRQVLISASLTGSFVVYALTINLFDSLLMFLLFGILPDGTEQLTPNQMLMMYLMIALGITSYVALPLVQDLARRYVSASRAKTSASA